jgi:hypothetical protein
MNMMDYCELVSHEYLQEMPLTTSQVRLQIILQIPENEDMANNVQFKICREMFVQVDIMEKNIKEETS